MSKKSGLCQRASEFFGEFGGAEFEEALDLIELAKARVLQEYGIHLEEEVKDFEIGLKSFIWNQAYPY